MEEKVLRLLSVKSMSFKELLNEGNFKSIPRLKEILSKLDNDLEIFTNKKGKYSLFSNSDLIKGTLVVVKDAESFILLDNYEKIIIPQTELYSVKDGDLVAVEVYKTKNNQQYGRVKKIKKKGKEIVGEVVMCKNGAYIIPDYDKSMRVYFEPVKGLVDGMKVVAELTDKIGKDTFNSKIIDIIGHKDDPNIELIEIFRNYRINPMFSDEIKEELELIPDKVSEKEEEDLIMRGGVDLRDQKTITLDGDDTKDYDDAISILKVGNYYNLKVSIANVSYYVKPGSKILEEAITRGTSVYFPGANIPMLDRKLSNGICSLNPGVDRIALTFDLLLDEFGNVIEFNIYDSIINSKKRMTYSEVNKILEEGIIVEGYEDYISELQLMKELQRKIRNNKLNQGYIDLEIEENNIKLDEDGKPVEVYVKKRGVAENIIEDFMVIVNEITSELLDEGYGCRQVYRVHGEPVEEKIESLRAYIKELGYSNDRLENLEARNIQIFLNSVKDKPEYKVIAHELLKCMKKAHYSNANIGHFALGASSVCQVTSPIRRIGDLINHILIRDYIYEIGKGNLTPNRISYISSQASITERNAAKCESEIKKMMMAEYMQEHLDEEVEGMITYVCKEGFIVELDNLIEGFVDINSLHDDKYYYMPDKFAIVGKHNGKKYMLGKKVNVEARWADKKDRSIHFAVKNKIKEKVKTLN